MVIIGIIIDMPPATPLPRANGVSNKKSDTCQFNLDVYHVVIHQIHPLNKSQGVPMNLNKIRKRFIPMTESMFYILYSLKEERHGYGIMQYVSTLTNGRIILGAGTIYQSISKLEKEHLIVHTKEENRQKKYLITDIGLSILQEEATKIKELYQIAKELL